MKKAAVILALIVAFTCIFSLTASAYQTKTDEFFSKIEQHNAVRIVPPETFETILLGMGDTSIRIFEDAASKKYIEAVSTAKIGFVEMKMFILRDKLYMYFPLFDCYIDYSIIYGAQNDQVVSEITQSLSRPVVAPAYSKRMYLTSSQEEETENFGKVYIEAFSYSNPHGIVKQLAKNGEITLPEGISIENICDFSLYELSEKLIALGGKEADVGFFISRNEAVFVYNSDGNLVACSYYSGEGADLHLEMYDEYDCKYIAPETDMSKFALPETSHNSILLSLLLRFVFIILSA